MRPVVFHPKARDVIREFPREVRDRLGKALYLLQAGEQPGMPLSRPMPTVGEGVSELRLHSEDGQLNQTPNSEIQLGRKRFREMQDV